MKGGLLRNSRIFFFCIVILIIYAIIIRRLFTLQVKDNVNFQVLANDQQGFSSQISTPRGIIQSSDGVELAINAPTYDVYVYTPNIPNEDIFKTTVLPLLHSDPATFSSDINDGIKYFQIASAISPDAEHSLKNNLSAGNYNALQFVLNEKRVYPNGSLLSQVLGFENISNGQGEYGLEGYFDQDLKGVAGSILGDKDQFG